MKKTNQFCSIGIAIVTIAFVLFLGFDVAGAVFSAKLSSLVAAGEYEPLKFEWDYDVQTELTGVNTK